jgi:hypothetical protein
MGDVQIRDLPEWLQKMICKKLSARMSAANVEQYMSGTLDKVTELFED